MIKRIQEIWLGLIGSASEFPLESRIFHSISLCLVLLSGFYVPYDISAGMYIAGVSSFIFSAIFFYQYYHSRYLRKPHNSLFFGLAGIIIFSFNYFANSGIHGSTDVIVPSYLLLLFAISPHRQHFTWLMVYLVCFTILHLVAYQYPQLVNYPFQLGKEQLIDRVTAFPLPIIGIYIVIKYMRRSYDAERKATEEKAIAIEIRNQQISQQKDQLEQSNAEKNKLMSIISHDLRAPLINIQSYLELLNSNELDDLQRPRFEKELLMATNNTMEMLSNLLHWSKSQMEGPTVNVLTLNLLDTVKSTLDMAKMQAQKKSILLTYQIDPHLIIAADTDMLQLVVRNLVSNAIKFTPEGGAINVDAQIIGDEYRISIRDNGKGIEEEKQPKIFSIHTQPTFGTNNEKGVGLGLALCKEYIERQGGRIAFESKPGKGSSFYIFIPAVRMSKMA